MHSRTLTPSLVLATSALALVAACSSTGFDNFSLGKKKDGLGQVDDLLTRVERVQVEAVISKDKSSEAYQALNALVDPDFYGDPVATFKELSESIEASSDQAEKLQDSVGPMKKVAERVFAEWTEGLESFGNGRPLRVADRAAVCQGGAHVQNPLEHARGDEGRDPAGFDDDARALARGIER